MSNKLGVKDILIKRFTTFEGYENLGDILNAHPDELSDESIKSYLKEHYSGDELVDYYIEQGIFKGSIVKLINDLTQLNYERQGNNLVLVDTPPAAQITRETGRSLKQIQYELKSRRIVN